MQRRKPFERVAATLLVIIALLSQSVHVPAQTGEPQSFTIDVSDEALQDLKRRLKATRFPDQMEGTAWTYGTDTAYLRELVDYWATDFDWRAEEARLNSFNNYRIENYRIEIDGQGLHYIHERSDTDDAIPLLMLHRWPSSFVQMLDIIPLLTSPENGGQAFHVVVASLPGYGFSDIPDEPGVGMGHMAALMHTLMTAALGYDRYGLRSGDLGAGVARSIALQFPDAIIGSHSGGTNPILFGPVPEDLTDAERAFVANAQNWMRTEMAYGQLHGTKPQTVAVALNDSPAGLASWICEKFHKWTDNDGRIEDAVSRDSFLTNVTVYWFTETINSSMRLYYEARREQLGRRERTIPVGYLMADNDMFPTPRAWIERQGPVDHWTETKQGGHFLEWEEPKIVANDLRAFFGGLVE